MTSKTKADLGVRLLQLIVSYGWVLTIARARAPSCPLSKTNDNNKVSGENFIKFAFKMDIIGSIK